MLVDPDKPIPQDGRVDPVSLDITAKPKRRRRARNRPKPAPELDRWAVGAEARALSADSGIIALSIPR